MQFVANGPDIPERLLQAHEDENVGVFFGGLVERLYSALATTPNAVQQAAIKANQFDTAVGLLETDIVGGRETVRRELVSINP